MALKYRPINSQRRCSRWATVTLVPDRKEDPAMLMLHLTATCRLIAVLTFPGRLRG